MWTELLTLMLLTVGTAVQTTPSNVTMSTNATVNNNNTVNNNTVNNNATVNNNTMVNNNNTVNNNDTMPTAVPPPTPGAIIGGLAAIAVLMGIICFCAVACRKNTEASFTKLKPAEDTTPAVEMGNVNAPTAGRRIRHVYNPIFFTGAGSYSPPRAMATGYPGVHNTAFVQ
ncbi:uncharacterized protein LOC144884816 [Branchiostoma floridae x Branchiostoma japonicum]